jgi:SpoU rRNA methylase family enzyme
MPLEGFHFQFIEDIQGNMMIVLKGLSEGDFQQCFQALQRYENVHVKQEMNTLKVDSVLRMKKRREQIF